MKRALLFVLSVAGLLSAQDLRITGGVVDDQVFQRNAGNRAGIPVSGVATGAGGKSVEVRLLRKYMVMEGFDWKPVARIDRGVWSGELPGVPMGGPYRIEARITGSGAATAVTGVLAGLLACAPGGESMDQWDPALKGSGGESLYGSMLRRVRAAGGKVTGVL